METSLMPRETLLSSMFNEYAILFLALTKPMLITTDTALSDPTKLCIYLLSHGVF
jgi:hypothetical protein